MKTFDYIDITEIAVQANPGAIIDRCLAEAAVLALSEHHNVVLYHNSMRYYINPSDIIDHLTSAKEVKL